MHILLDYRPALREPTGVGEYAHELAAALARTSSDSDRLTLFTSSWADRPEPGLAVEWARTSVLDRRIPVRVLNWAWNTLAWPPVESLGAAVDIVQASGPLLMPTRRARQAITIHDLDFLLHPERMRADTGHDYRALVRTHAARAALIVTISHDTAAAIVTHLDVSPERLVVCRPGLPTWIGEPVVRDLPLDGYVLFLGTLEPRKNLGALLDAWELLLSEGVQLPRLRIAGASRPEARAWLERLAVPPLAGHVDYVGYVNASDRRSQFAGAQLLVMPSLHEGFGLPVLEAMALGVPVVTSNRGALPEVVGDAGLMVDAEDRRGLAAAIRSLLENREHAERLRRQAAVRAATFTWDRAARELRSAYARLLSPTPGGRA